MEHYLAAAEAAAPDDPDLRAGAWAIGRGIGALLAEDRIGARQAFARARAEAPDQHARILNPYEGPELLLRALAARRGTAEIDAASAGVVKGARWPELWFGAARAVAGGADGDAAGAVAALTAALGRRPLPGLLRPDDAPGRGGSHPGRLGNARRCCSARRTPPSPGCGWAGRRRPAALCSRRRATPRHAGGPPTPDCPPRLIAAGVTAREAEVLDLLADRLSNREIAGLLFLSPRTVEKHVAALLAKLGGEDRGGLARLARSLR